MYCDLHYITPILQRRIGTINRGIQYILDIQILLFAVIFLGHGNLGQFICNDSEYDPFVGSCTLYFLSEHSPFLFDHLSSFFPSVYASNASNEQLHVGMATDFRHESVLADFGPESLFGSGSRDGNLYTPAILFVSLVSC